MSGKQRFILFSQPINPDTVHRLLGVLAECATNDADTPVCLMISSTGANTIDGFHAYTSMRSLPLNLTTYNSYTVQSIAVVLFLAGTTRIAHPISAFAFHGHAFGAEENLDAPTLAARADTLRREHDAVRSVLTDRTSIAPDVAANLVGGPTRDLTFKNAHWARENGLVDDVRVVEIPQGSDVVQV